MSQSDEPSQSSMTREQILALPAVVNLAVASRALGLHPDTGYDLAKQGRFPVTAHRISRQYRVPTAEILRFLGIDATPAA